ncbi:glycosyltransferase family 4 protein [Robertkochia aurantiaca]|uniref:glycosyltransferase family 4 protein n=1 Tax=Robertkochia aurantiaca TaxID=2873700 RepID=UPI001CCEA27B|nr:glycosyltransferase family 4 protein [Robertkochia sp. 3YJGBD-33]
MKIVILHQYFLTAETSGNTRAYDLSRLLIELGHQVTLITSSGFVEQKTNKIWSEIQLDGITIKILKTLKYDNSKSYFLRVLEFLYFAILASIRLVFIKTDLVIVSSPPLTIGIPALVKKYWDGTDYFFEARDVWPEAAIAIGALKNKLLKRIAIKLEAMVYCGSSHIIPLSVDMESSILRRFDKNSLNTTVIENIALVDMFSKRMKDHGTDLKRDLQKEGSFSIVYAGAFGDVNGLEYVIRLAYELRKRDGDINFYLYGKGKQKEQIIALAKSLKVLDKNVFFKDPVSKAVLPCIYSQVEMGSSFVISISELWANSANKFFDSLAAGRPVLINYGGWQSDLIKSANVGYVLPSKVEELNEVILDDFIRYCSKKELHQIQRENALKLSQNFSYQNFKVKYGTILQDYFQNKVLAPH